MSTINNLVSGAYGVGALKTTQSQMNELRSRFNSKEITYDDYKTRMEELKDERSAIVSAGIENADNGLVSNLFSYMNNGSGGENGGMWGGGTFDTSIFFEGKNELTQLKAMNFARIGIENRARSLVGEIARDRARGIDVSVKQKTLENLTGNLNILDKNLDTSIQRALQEPNRETQYVDIIGKMRKALEEKTAVSTEPEEPTLTEQIAENAAPKSSNEMNTAEQIADKAKAEHSASVEAKTSGNSEGTATNVVE